MDRFNLMNMAGWGNQSNGLGTGNLLDLNNNYLSGIGSPVVSGNAPNDWLNQLQTANVAGTGDAGGGFLAGMLGRNGQQGWGNLALGALQGIGGAYMGMKQYGLAKDALQQSQSQFNKNYNAQRQSMNTQLEDRQAARVAASGGTAESVDSYMARNRIN